jgi:predicted aminopeptidase
LFAVLLLSLIALVTTGCGNAPPGYIFSAISGQLDFMRRAQPIDQALTDSALTEEQRDKLAFVVRARDYAESEIGLYIGNSYQSFVNLQGAELLYNLSASRKDRFDSYIWSFPLVGSIPYIGFFSLQEAEVERDRLRELNYDTVMYEVDSYSIPYLPDPITSPMLDRSIASLADTVMHELLHNTILKQDDVVFSESLASFVGRTAGLQFLATEFGDESEEVVDARGRYEDIDLWNGYIESLIDELNVLYMSDASSEEKIQQRKVIFDGSRERFASEIQPQLNNPEAFDSFVELNLELNNAYLLLNVRYNEDLDVMSDVFEMTGRNWSATLGHFEDAANTADSFAYLRSLVTSNQP